jgi:hypothetical protein
MICWAEKDAGWLGYLKGYKHSADHKYYINKLFDGECLADVWDFKEEKWVDINVRFPDLDSAMLWCSTVEATGAY